MDPLRIVKLIADWRARRDERSWTEFRDTHAKAAAAGMRLGEVVRVRQEARTGTKAYMRWIDGGDVNAVWVWSARLRRG